MTARSQRRQQRQAAAGGIGAATAMAAPAMAESIAGQIRALDAADGGGNVSASSGSAAAAGGPKTPYYVRRIDVGTRYKALSDGDGGDGGASAISGLAGKDGRVHLGMEIDSLIRDVAPDLYEHFTAFIREDMNNALRQVRQARSRGRKAHVHVILNRDARTVEVHDVDTDGMPVAVFRDVYTVLGRSGNLDGRESGQKGIGRFAFLAASDTKIVETHARETGERYGFIIRGGKVFEPIPDDMLSISEYGTRTSVCVDDRHDFDDLPAYVRTIAAASKAPVYLTTSGFARNCSMARVSGKGGLGCSCRDAVRVKTDDFEFVGCMRCKGLPNRGADASYLIGIPVKTHAANPFGGLFHTTTLNILDERKYEPTTSRDWLSKSASGRIWKEVRAAVEEELSRIECDHARLLSDVPAIVVAAGACDYVVRYLDVDGNEVDEDDAAAVHARAVSLRDILSESVKSAVRKLSKNYDVLAVVDRRGFDRGAIPRAKIASGEDRRFSRSKYDIDNKIVPRTLRWIVELIGDNGGQVWYAPSTAIKWRRAAFEYVEDGRGAVIFLENEEGWEELERLGAKRIAPYAAAGTAGKRPGIVTVRYGTYAERKAAGDLGPDDICVPRDPGVTRIGRVCVEMRRDGIDVPRLGICPWHEAAGDSDAETFDHMRASVDARVYRTAAGPMTGREILDVPRERLAVCPVDDEWVRAVCDDRVVSDAAGEGVVAVYRTEDADGDRLWLAYGFENDGSMPRTIKGGELKEAALASLGVPRKFAKYRGSMLRDCLIPDEPRMVVGHLRMLSGTVQKVAYLRLVAQMRLCIVDNRDTRELEQAAIYLSETDPSLDDLGLCMHVLRDLNKSGHCDAMDHRYSPTWRYHLMAIAVNRLARNAMGCGLCGADDGLYDSRRLPSADGAERLIGGILTHLFGSDTAVKAAVDENGVVAIDAVLGRDGGEGAHLSATLSRMLFGHRPSHSIDATMDGRIRIRGAIGHVPDKGDENGGDADGDFGRSSHYDSW